MGSALAGGATLLFMAGMNYGYSCYKEYCENQSKARAEAVNAINRAAVTNKESAKTLSL